MEEYAIGDIMLVHADGTQNADNRTFVHIIELKNKELFFVPFLISHAIPIPVAFLRHLNPVCIGAKNEKDFQETEDLIKTKLLEQNERAWTLISDRCEILSPQ